MARNIVPINRMNKFLLYGLYDPVTIELRYVGITTRDLKNRLNEHLRKPTNHMVKKWFKKLDEKELKPIIKLIKTFNNYNDLLKSEIETIKRRNTTLEKNKTFKSENNPNFKFNIFKDELERLYLKDNLTLKDLANNYGCSMVTISNNIKKYGIVKPKNNKYNLNYIDIIKYRNNGMTLKSIGEIYGCSQKYIHKYIKKHKQL